MRPSTLARMAPVSYTHLLNDLMSVAADKLRALADSNTVVGQPIQTGDVTLIPVARLSFGIASGGTEYSCLLYTSRCV